MEHFHCCEDNNYVKNKVFEILYKHKESIKIYSLIVKKSLVPSSLMEVKDFYSAMLFRLLGQVSAYNLLSAGRVEEFIIITDQIPIAKKRKAIEKGIKKLFLKLNHLLNLKFYTIHQNLIPPYKLLIIAIGQYLENGRGKTIRTPKK